MMSDLWNSTVAWFGIGGALVVAAGAVAYFFPPLRKQAIIAGGAILGVLAIYGKGASDAKRRQQQKQDAAAGKIQDKYRQIDNQPNNAVDDLRKGKF